MRIIFVDDENNVLQGLRRSLRSQRKEWDMIFLSSGQEALELLNTGGQFDIIISDMRMPGMDGATLLQYVKDHYPHMTRFALSGQSEVETTYRLTHLAHQYLSKPCDAEVLKKAIYETAHLQALLNNEIIRKILASMSTIPSMPAVYERVINELQSGDPSLKQIGKIIAEDAGMTAKVLQLVNTAFFGVPRHISNAEQAATMLGLENLKSLVLSVGIFSLFEPDLFTEFRFEHLWHHSMAVGTAARAVTVKAGLGTGFQEDAFVGGLLHDIGKLVLATNIPVRYMEVLEMVRANGMTLIEAEKELLHSTHAEIGAFLLGVWGLPREVVESVAYHHEPSRSISTDFHPFSAVHLANAEFHEFYPGGSGISAGLDLVYFESVGVSDKIELFQEICRQVFEREKNVNV